MDLRAPGKEKDPSSEQYSEIRIALNRERNRTGGRFTPTGPGAGADCRGVRYDNYADYAYSYVRAGLQHGGHGAYPRRYQGADRAAYGGRLGMRTWTTAPYMTWSRRVARRFWT